MPFVDPRFDVLTFQSFGVYMKDSVLCMCFCVFFVLVSAGMILPRPAPPPCVWCVFFLCHLPYLFIFFFRRAFFSSLWRF